MSNRCKTLVLHVIFASAAKKTKVKQSFWVSWVNLVIISLDWKCKTANNHHITDWAIKNQKEIG